MCNSLWEEGVRLPVREKRDFRLLENSFKVPNYSCPAPYGSVDWSIVLYTKRPWVQFLVRAHTWVVGSALGRGTYGEGDNQSVFLFLCLSLPLSLSLLPHLFLPFPLFPLKKKKINGCILGWRLRKSSNLLLSSFRTVIFKMSPIFIKCNVVWP